MKPWLYLCSLSSVQTACRSGRPRTPACRRHGSRARQTSRWRPTCCWRCTSWATSRPTSASSSGWAGRGTTWEDTAAHRLDGREGQKKNVVLALGMWYSWFRRPKKPLIFKMGVKTDTLGLGNELITAIDSNLCFKWIQKCLNRQIRILTMSVITLEKQTTSLSIHVTLHSCVAFFLWTIHTQSTHSVKQNTTTFFGLFSWLTCSLYE